MCSIVKRTFKMLFRCLTQSSVNQGGPLRPLRSAQTTVPLEVTGLVKKGQIIIVEKVPEKQKFLHGGMTHQLNKSQRSRLTLRTLLASQEENLNAFVHLLDSSNIHLVRPGVLLVNTALCKLLQMLTLKRQFLGDISRMTTDVYQWLHRSSFEFDPRSQGGKTVRIDKLGNSKQSVLGVNRPWEDNRTFLEISIWTGSHAPSRRKSHLRVI